MTPRSPLIQTAMLMSAGLGTRMHPFSDLTPKPLLPILGIPLMQFTLDRLLASGVLNWVVNLHHLPEKLKAGYESLDRSSAAGEGRFHWSDETRQLLGSAGGLAQAARFLSDQPFFLINADVLWDTDLEELSQRHFQLREQWDVDLTLLIRRSHHPTEKYRAMHLDHPSGLIKDFGGLETGSDYFASVAILEPRILKNIPTDRPTDFVSQILKPALERKKAGFHLASGPWMDLGSPALWWEAHLSLMEQLEKGTLPPSWRTRIESANRRLSAGVWCSKKSKIGSWMGSAATAGPAYVDGAPPEIRPHCLVYGSPHSVSPQTIYYQDLSLGLTSSPKA